MVFVTGCEMIHDCDRFQHPGIANQGIQFFALIGPVQPCCDQHGNAIGRDAGSHQRTDHRLQKQCIGNRPGEVANQDARTFAPFCQLIKRGRIDR